MATYLLTWNPNKWVWDDLNDAIAKTRNGGRYRARWNVHAHKQIVVDDRVFLLRQGSHPKGVVASGVIVTGPYVGKHWDPEKQDADVYHVDVDFDTVLDPNNQEVFPARLAFQSGPEGNRLGYAILRCPASPGNRVQFRTGVAGLGIQGSERWSEHASKAPDINGAYER